MHIGIYLYIYSLFAAVSSCKMSTADFTPSRALTSTASSQTASCFLPKPNVVVDPPEIYKFGIPSGGSNSLNLSAQ